MVTHFILKDETPPVLGQGRPDQEAPHPRQEDPPEDHLGRGQVQEEVFRGLGGLVNVRRFFGGLAGQHRDPDAGPAQGRGDGEGRRDMASGLPICGNLSQVPIDFDRSFRWRWRRQSLEGQKSNSTTFVEGAMVLTSALAKFIEETIATTKEEGEEGDEEDEDDDAEEIEELVRITITAVGATFQSSLYRSVFLLP